MSINSLQKPLIFIILTTVLTTAVTSFQCSPNCVTCFSDTCLYCFDSQFDKAQTNCQSAKTTNHCQLYGTVFPSRCLVCEEKFNLAYGKCFPMSPKKVIKNCRNGVFEKRNGYTCQICENGYCPSEDGQSCVKNPKIDLNCDWCRSKNSITKCFRCRDGYVLDKFSGVCRQKTAALEGCLQVGLQDKCFICDGFAGYGMPNSFNKDCVKRSDGVEVVSASDE